MTEWMYLMGAVVGLLRAVGSLIEHVQIRRTAKGIMRSLTTTGSNDVEIRSPRGLTVRIRTGEAAGPPLEER
ncbi:hypothetical protein KRM28CT15_15820 [Krasilnikovia sp. M28-CT-15]